MKGTSVWSGMTWWTLTICCSAAWTWCLATLCCVPTGRTSSTRRSEVNPDWKLNSAFIWFIWSPLSGSVCLMMCVCRTAGSVPRWRPGFPRWASSLCVGQAVWAAWRFGGGGERHQTTLLQTLHTEAVPQTCKHSFSISQMQTYFFYFTDVQEIHGCLKLKPMAKEQFQYEMMWSRNTSLFLLIMFLLI